MKKYGLVLAGGGGKGAYQIGAWKAMREMGIEFEAIAGASIGGINGAFIAAGDYDKAVEFWHNISVDKGVRIAKNLPDSENLFSRKNTPIPTAKRTQATNWEGVKASVKISPL